MHLQTIHTETHHQTKCVQCIMAKITAYFNNNGSWCSFTLAQQRSTAESKVCAAHIVPSSFHSKLVLRQSYTHTHLSTFSESRLLFDRVNFNNSKNFSGNLESVMHISYFMYSDFIGITIFTVSLSRMWSETPATAMRIILKLKLNSTAELIHQTIHAPMHGCIYICRCIICTTDIKQFQNSPVRCLCVQPHIHSLSTHFGVY